MYDRTGLSTKCTLINIDLFRPSDRNSDLFRPFVEALTKTIWYRKYGSWETDAIIANEMFIGVGTAAGCIFCVTVIMINSFVTAVIVMLCCLLTLTFVGG